MPDLNVLDNEVPIMQCHIIDHMFEVHIYKHAKLPTLPAYSLIRRSNTCNTLLFAGLGSLNPRIMILIYNYLCLQGTQPGIRNVQGEHGRVNCGS